MKSQPDFLPTATLADLQLRAYLLAVVRRFFDGRGYFEVDTPLLSHDRVVDPHLDPFVCTGPAGPLYLQTSPEFAMKRLLAAGARAIYQVGHVFRAGELGRRHNPEFTMVEWYRTGDTHVEQMQVVEDLVVEVFHAAVKRRPSAFPAGFPSAFARSTYRDAFRRHTGQDVILMTAAQMATLSRDRGVSIPDSLDPTDCDGWLNLLLAELVEPSLGKNGPEFVHDYPASQAALAVIRPDDPPVAERFELYIDGIELCNGYHELTDPSELRRRIDVESRRRVAEGLSPLPSPIGCWRRWTPAFPPAPASPSVSTASSCSPLEGRRWPTVIPFGFERA